MKTVTKTTITVEGTGYPLIRLTAKKALDVCGMHICKGEVFFLVRSRKGSQEYIPLRWNYERCSWQCSCEHGCRMHKHTALVSMYSAKRPYGATHPAGCPKVVKTEEIVTAKEDQTTSTVSSQSVLPEVVENHGDEGADKAGSQIPALSDREIGHLNIMLPNHKTCILRRGSLRLPVYRNQDGQWQFFVQDGKVVEFSNSKDANTFIAEQKKGAPMDREAQVEEAKKEILLEEEIARRLSLLKSEKMDGLKFIAMSRKLEVKSRNRIDYINAIIEDIRKSLESKEVAA